MTILSNAERIRQYVKDHPEATPIDVTNALGLSRKAYFDAFRDYSSGKGQGTRPPSIDYQERARKLLPMLSGAGDRHEDCRSYETCLTKAASMNCEAHCPESCTDYRQVPREYYRALGMVRREAQTGVAVHLRTVGRNVW